MTDDRITFLRLTDAKRKCFDNLFVSVGSTLSITKNGERASVEPLPEYVIYLVDGYALFRGGGIDATLGDRLTFNAVVVPPAHPHGWTARQDGSKVRRVAGALFVEAVLIPSDVPIHK